jgi:S-adenosylmethionine:tRNA ribosyltransferase-isomerase
MFLSDFDFELPDELIARYPAAERRDSRLLVVGESLEDRRFVDLPAFLRPGDLLVFNDTRVIRARLRGTKVTGGKVEILVERLLTDGRVLAQVRASKSPKPGGEIALPGGIHAVVGERQADLFLLTLPVDVEDYLEAHGEVPLPPYLERGEEPVDASRYQTVYASEAGAVAAPTAGLHFDEPMLDQLAEAGIATAFVTLHVGAGTFQPLREERVDANRLHAERVTVGSDVCDAVEHARSRGGRIIAVGTTTVRSLEAASAGGTLATFDGETDIFIYPGYEFRTVEVMLTNFHLPRSSLMMLVSAFAGRERVLEAYRHAVDDRYRFFSYGDAMLLTRGTS